ncbi:putative lipid II flippase FtsW [Allobacillus sp. GCM10007491]|uniref:Probable peptidoglycan glycosyltransferase FtsW n=1 Tax=Allobacillus saliphilus TaxID=2912308 RepID=A0A941CWY6_9BACI|nr:putative lipid II flippase FtsW [uncultured Allobacillus sp.]MBR7554691.1 putative lipid II flippase FtsW [Allobacillus saliphilus]
MKNHLKNIDYPLFVIILLLASVGIVMVYSASFVFAGLDPDLNNPDFFFDRQRIFLAIGFAIFGLMSLFNYRKLGPFIPIFILGTILLLILVLIPGVGVTRNEATRWLNLGFILLQPSEVAKVALILYFAKAYTNKQEKLHHFGQGVMPPLIVLLFVFLLIVLQPDLGTAVSIIIPCGIILMFAGIRFRHLFLLGGTALAGVVLLILTEGYRMERLTGFLDPFSDPSGEDYQLVHSLIAIASGQVNGVGLSNSVQKAGFLPEAHTDFIMSVIAEELGLIGVLFVIGLYIAFMFKGLMIAKRATDQFGQLLAYGITFQITSQVFINLGAITGLMPITGITLPLISYGGSSLLITFFLLGILMNIAVKGNIRRRGMEPKRENAERTYQARSL